MKLKFCVIFLISLMMSCVFAEWVRTASASSEFSEVLGGKKIIYSALNAFDGDFSTAWVPESNSSGIGETLQIVFDKAIEFDEIQIINGFAYKNLYMHNNRVKSLKVSVLLAGAGSGGEITQEDFTLNDNMSEYYQSMNYRNMQRGNVVVFEITDIYKGQKYDDTCISEIRFYKNGRELDLVNINKIKKARNAVLNEMSWDEIKSTNRKFYSLQKGSVKSSVGPIDGVLFLKSVDYNDGYYLWFDKGEFSHMLKCKFYSAPAMSVMLREGEMNWCKTDLEKLGISVNDYDYYADVFPPYSDRRYFSYDNAKIITKENIVQWTYPGNSMQLEIEDYIQIENDKVFINGIEYEVINNDSVFYLTSDI